MTTLLAVYNTQTGMGRNLVHTLDVPDQITARELIRRRIETEIGKHNETVQQNHRRSTQAYLADTNAWLVVPGDVERTLNGERPAYGPRPGIDLPRAPELLDTDLYIETAFEAFASNGFFMIFDGRQVTDLDEVLHIHHDSTLTFIRLTPLVGG